MRRLPQLPSFVQFLAVTPCERVQHSVGPDHPAVGSRTGTAAELGVRQLPWVEAHPVNGRNPDFSPCSRGPVHRAPPILRKSQIGMGSQSGADSQASTPSRHVWCSPTASRDLVEPSSSLPSAFPHQAEYRAAHAALSVGAIPRDCALTR